MNYWDYEELGNQTFTITPRENVGGSVIAAFTADTTLFTADSILQTADQTEVVTGLNTFVIEYNEDGVYTKQTANATASENGSFLDLTATLSINPNTFYYFRVFIDNTEGTEIFRGKSFTYDVLPAKPLHYSMYDDNEIK